MTQVFNFIKERENVISLDVSNPNKFNFNKMGKGAAKALSELLS